MDGSRPSLGPELHFLRRTRRLPTRSAPTSHGARPPRARARARAVPRRVASRARSGEDDWPTAPPRVAVARVTGAPSAPSFARFPTVGTGVARPGGRAGTYGPASSHSPTRTDTVSPTRSWRAPSRHPRTPPTPRTSPAATSSARSSAASVSSAPARPFPGPVLRPARLAPGGAGGTAAAAATPRVRQHRRRILPEMTGDDGTGFPKRSNTSPVGASSRRVRPSPGRPGRRRRITLNAARMLAERQPVGASAHSSARINSPSRVSLGAGRALRGAAAAATSALRRQSPRGGVTSLGRGRRRSRRRAASDRVRDRGHERAVS